MSLKLCLLLLFMPHESFRVHHFYVSKTIMNYSPVKGTIEMTTRFFTDDLEKAISSFSSSEFSFKQDGDASDAQKVSAYLDQHLKISINGSPIQCNWVGMETEVDLTYCYLEIAVGEYLRNVEIMNDCLMEIFPEQQNIIDLSIQSTTQTAILVKGANRHLFVR